MPANTGYQQVTVKFFDPVDSEVANRIGVGSRKIGIYSGGYVTRVSDVSATVTALDCEIGDETDQVRIQTGVGGSGTITVTGLDVDDPYIVMKWDVTDDADTEYMEMVAESAVNVLANPDWVIVCKCSFPEGTLTPGYGWDSTDRIITRTNPNVQDLFLKVEPTVAASMYVRIRGGRVSYGDSNFEIADQVSPLLVAPGSNARIAAIQVNTSGGLIVTYGSAGASPDAPDYGNLITLAEIRISSGASTITTSMIKDVRPFLGNGAQALPGSVVQVVNVVESDLIKCTTQLPKDDTIPLITEGDEVMERVVTPRSATNKLKIEVTATVCQNQTGYYSTIALYLKTGTGSSVNAIRCGTVKNDYGNNTPTTITFSHYMTAGAATELIFSVNCGSSHGSDILFLNGHSTGGANGTRIFGGVLASSITITEIKV